MAAKKLTLKDQNTILKQLGHEKPIAFNFKDDGRLVVIAATGQKFVYSAETLAAVFPAK
jgi:hypothetical protein